MNARWRATIARAARQGLLAVAVAGVSGFVGAGASLGASFPLGADGSPVTVPVRIGEHGPFDFILDTGAAGTLIDESLAQKLALPVTGEVMVASPLGEGGLARATVSLAGVAVGEVQLPDLEAVLFDLATTFGSADGPRGVLSIGAFQEHLVTFNYPAGRVEISPGALPEPDGQAAWAYPAEATIPELPLVVAGRPVSIRLDSGAPGGITLPLAMAAELALDGEPVVVGHGGMVDRTFDIYAATLDGAVTIGATRIDHPRLAFIEGLPRGHVGIRFLQSRVITVDPANHRIRLIEGPSSEGARVVARPRPVSAAVPPKRYGIRFYPGDPGPIRVDAVDEGFPAHAAGLRAGDRIIEINGRPVGELGPDDRAAAFRASPLELGVLRGEERLVLTMSLE